MLPIWSHFIFKKPNRLKVKGENSNLKKTGVTILILDKQTKNLKDKRLLLEKEGYLL